MEGIENYIEGSQKLTTIFGRWPTFHDAEVSEIHLQRGDVNPSSNRWVFPSLTAKLRLWELTDQTDSNGFLITRNRRAVTIQFHDLNEDLELKGFNHQNALNRLLIERVKVLDSDSFVFKIRFASSFGVEAQFSCRRIMIAEVNADRSHEQPPEHSTESSSPHPGNAG